MRSRRILSILCLALAAFLLSNASAEAFWLKGHGGPVYKQRVVIRGGWGPGFGFAPGVPLVGGTTLRTGEAAFFSESFGLGGFTLTPGVRESYFFRGSEAAEATRELIRKEVERHVAERSEALGTGASPGTGAKPGTGTAVCTELKGRLDKIEARLTDLSTKVASIEAKVTQLLGEKDQKQKLESLVKVVVQEVKGQVEEVMLRQNANLATLFREAFKDKKDRNEALIEKALRALTAP